MAPAVTQPRFVVIAAGGVRAVGGGEQRERKCKGRVVAGTEAATRFFFALFDAVGP